MTLKSVEKCPVCGDLSAGTICDFKKFILLQCRNCSHRYLNRCLDDNSMVDLYASSQNIEKADRSHAQYYEYDIDRPGNRTRRDYELALDLLEKELTGRNLLEVGCGAGMFLKVGKRRGWNVEGIDPSPSNTQKLQEEGIPAHPCRFLDFRGKDRYDAIVFWDVLEHIPEPSIFLDRCRELLAPDGVILVAGPRYPNLLSCMALGIYRGTFGCVRGPMERMYFVQHVSYFNEKTLARLLAKSGFVQTDTRLLETDLKRYAFSLAERVVVGILFVCARALKLQNRFLAVFKRET